MTPTTPSRRRGTTSAVDIRQGITLCRGAEQVSFTVVSASTDGTTADGVAVSEENDRGCGSTSNMGTFDMATCGDVNGDGDVSRTDVETAMADAFRGRR